MSERNIHTYAAECNKMRILQDFINTFGEIDKEELNTYCSRDPEEAEILQKMIDKVPDPIQWGNIKFNVLGKILYYSDISIYGTDDAAAKAAETLRTFGAEPRCYVVITKRGKDSFGGRPVVSADDYSGTDKSVVVVPYRGQVSLMKISAAFAKRKIRWIFGERADTPPFEKTLYRVWISARRKIRKIRADRSAPAQS